MTTATKQGPRLPFSFRHRIAGACALSGIAAAAIATAVLARESGIARRQDAERRLSVMAATLCRNTDSYLALHAAALGQVADAALPSGNAPRAEQLVAFQQRFPGYLTLLAAGLDGRVRATSREIVGADAHFSVSDRPYFQRALRGESPYISHAFVGRGMGTDPLVAVSHPLRDATGRVTGVVEGSLDLQRLGTVASGVPAPGALAFVVMIDPRGRVVYANGQPAGRQWAPMSPVTTDPLIARLTEGGDDAVATVNGETAASCRNATGWHVFVGQPVAVLLTAQRGAWAIGGVTLLLLTAAALLVGHVTARRLTAPLDAIVRRMDGIARRAPADGRGAVPPSEPLAAIAADSSTSWVAPEWALCWTHLSALDARVFEADHALRLALANRDEVIRARTEHLETLNQQLGFELQAVAAAEEALRLRQHRLELVNGIAAGVIAGHESRRIARTAVVALRRAFPEWQIRLHDATTHEPDAPHVEALRDGAPLAQCTWPVTLGPGRPGSLVVVAPAVQRWPVPLVDTIADLARHLDIAGRHASQKDALEASEVRYRHLVESASDVIGRTDRDGRFSYVNPAAEVLLGYPAATLIGTPFTDLLVEEHRAAAMEAYASQQARREQHGYLEHPMRHRNGETIWVGVHAQLLVENGRVVGMQAVGRDITAQRTNERQRADFLASASHELRTPLTSIRGAVGLLIAARARAADRSADSTTDRLLALAQTSTDRLLRLTDSLLELQRVTGELPAACATPVSLADVIHEAADIVRGAAADRDLHLSIESREWWILADREELVRVVVNLLGNAVKFSPRGGDVLLTVQEVASTVRVEVCDRGPGVAAADRERIFGRFQRAALPASHAAPGSGLGLAISRAIAGRHRGTLHVEPRDGGGSRFVLTLPGNATAMTGTAVAA